MQQISTRLRKVASYVTKGHKIADIGCDHGYIPIYLVKTGISPSAIAMDINKGPLERAREHIKMEHLESQIETRQSDGLKAYRTGEADTIIISGMGGQLITQILKQAEIDQKRIKELILSPHSEIAKVRHYLNQHNYKIIQEDMIKEVNKYYTILKCIHIEPMESKEPIEPKEPTPLIEPSNKEIHDIYGKTLLESRHPILYEYIKKEQKKCDTLLNKLEQTSNPTESTIKRIQELREQKNNIKEALRYYESE